jgi:hypothetical protein
MNQDESLYTVNITIAKESNEIWISVFNNDNLSCFDWIFSEIEVDGKKIKFDILDLKYFKINSINNLNNTITWINIDIDKFKNIEILQETTL